ncbi:hypothetical protein N7509_003038 [Penicillium cosmopolitanum]|uniref:Uncharacterized protein n=1 Tax=Penicillium cosmopolitanum TaxID=1131564 RepID=A0A9X0BB39_9EURO|nr:uncharacterized protein N7509_003038 [Penicillium cosmopolitanum]KAJ5403167.1 hypothetical protein N7509_003038 [Penicillium cosmopolitanum]
MSRTTVLQQYLIRFDIWLYILMPVLNVVKKQLKPLDTGYNKLCIHYIQTDYIQGYTFTHLIADFASFSQKTRIISEVETKELEQYFSLQKIKAYPEEVKVKIDSISNYKEEDIVDPKEREEIPSLDSYNYKELQLIQSLLLS